MSQHWTSLLREKLGPAYSMTDLNAIVQTACERQGVDDWKSVFREFKESGFKTLPLILRNELSLYDGTAYR